MEKNPATQAFVRMTTKDMEFTKATLQSQQEGNIHADRINHWQQVDPLESLAAAHPVDDMIVALPDPVEVKTAGEGPQVEEWSLMICKQPMQITGRYYALVKVLEPVNPQENPPEHLRVMHFNRVSRQFDGAEEVVWFPAVQFAQVYGSYPSTTRDLEKMPPNEVGWYIYGAKDARGQFVVQAIAPRALLRLQPDQVLLGEKAAWKYLKQRAWDLKGQKGKTSSVLLLPFLDQGSENQVWQEGDRALVLHTYGGIGGKNREPAAKGSLFFGHFSYGVATVVREPLADELMFDILYYQVYTHNVDGITAGPIAWCAYMGDRQVGWLGSRPVCDLLIKHHAFTRAFSVHGTCYSVLDILIQQLECMTARYWIGDGTGGTFVSIAHNCSQDSNQAFYMALKQVEEAIQTDLEQDDPGRAERYQQLLKLVTRIRKKLLPCGSAHADWQHDRDTLGITPGQNLIQTILIGVQSWPTLLPRVASETTARQFIRQQAAVWGLRTNQVGGYDPNIEPLGLTRIG
ncbi:hypothetical protein [Leptodesmis sp.]|uniref:hypothetical protein n=1 Tax=Leptodesmis sp. TaxID=3100501 RepID=UPI00405350A0